MAFNDGIRPGRTIINYQCRYFCTLWFYNISSRTVTGLLVSSRMDVRARLHLVGELRSPGRHNQTAELGGLLRSMLILVPFLCLSFLVSICVFLYRLGSDDRQSFFVHEPNTTYAVKQWNSDRYYRGDREQSRANMIDKRVDPVNPIQVTLYARREARQWLDQNWDKWTANPPTFFTDAWKAIAQPYRT